MIRVLTAINLCANFMIEVYHEVLKHHRTERSVVVEEGEALSIVLSWFYQVLMETKCKADSEAF